MARTRKTAAVDVKHKPSPWRYVEVTWLDATSDSAWCRKDGLPDMASVITRGWLVRKTAKCVTIAASYGLDVEDPDIGEMITIPRGTIESVRELKDARWESTKV